MSNETYLISEAAKELNVENHVLRYWEEELGIEVKRNEKGHRYYSGEDVIRFRRIKELKDRGLQLKAIRIILRNGTLEKSAVLMQMNTNPDNVSENPSVSLQSVKKEVPEVMPQGTYRIQEKTLGKKKGGVRNRKYEAARAKRFNKARLLCPSQPGIKEISSRREERQKEEKGIYSCINEEVMEEKNLSEEGNASVETAESVGGQGDPRKENYVESENNPDIKKETPVEPECIPDNRESAEINRENETGDEPVTDRREEQDDRLPKNYLQTGESEMLTKNSVLTNHFDDEKQEKAFRLQLLLKSLISDAVRENNTEICENVKDGILKELDYHFRELDRHEDEREQKRITREERYYKKMDEMIRSKLDKGKKKKHSLF